MKTIFNGEQIFLEDCGIEKLDLPITFLNNYQDDRVSDIDVTMIVSP